MPRLPGRWRSWCRVCKSYRCADPAPSQSRPGASYAEGGEDTCEPPAPKTKEKQ